MEDVRWLNEREERAWRALQFMQMRLEGELARQLAADSGLSYPDYLVLVALTDRPDGRMRLFELGRTCSGWEKSRLSHHVARMADRGLVTKEKCDSDRRGAFVVVTKRAARRSRPPPPGTSPRCGACSSTGSPPTSSTPSARPPPSCSPRWRNRPHRCRLQEAGADGQRQVEPMQTLVLGATPPE